MKNCSSDEKQKSFAKLSTSYRLLTKNLKLKADSPASPLHANILVAKKRSNRSSLFASFFTILVLASSYQFRRLGGVIEKMTVISIFDDSCHLPFSSEIAKVSETVILQPTSATFFLPHLSSVIIISQG